MKYMVTHNGMHVEFKDTKEEVEAYIKKCLDVFEHLTPRKIFDSEPEDSGKRVIIYKYYTMYSEMFLIEEMQ